MSFRQRAIIASSSHIPARSQETGGADILSNPRTPELKEFMAEELRAQEEDLRENRRVG